MTDFPCPFGPDRIHPLRREVRCELGRRSCATNSLMMVARSGVIRIFNRSPSASSWSSSSLGRSSEITGSSIALLTLFSIISISLRKSNAS